MRKFERDSNNAIVCDEDAKVWTAAAMRRPDSFAYFGDDKDKMFHTWALGPIIEHRDSDALQRSNAEALRRFLASDPSLNDDYRLTESSHWAVGHVTHLSFRAYYETEKGKVPTRIARILAAWFEYLEKQHPVADEDLQSEMEDEEAQQVWTNCYSNEERLEYIRKHRSQFEFHNFSDLMGCVRGKYFAGWASELIYR